MNYEANLDWSFFNRHMLRSHVHDVRLIDGVDEQVVPEPSCIFIFSLVVKHSWHSFLRILPFNRLFIFYTRHDLKVMLKPRFVRTCERSGLIGNIHVHRKKRSS